MNDHVGGVRRVWRTWRIGVALAGGIAAALPISALPALGQDFPAHSVKIVVPFPAGGTADVLPRILGDFLSRKWGHSVVIENRTGAGGNIGAEAVAKAEPDGYTLLATPPSPLAVNQNLYAKLSFEPADFVPVTVMARVPNALVVSPKLNIKTLDELIAYARANPGKLSYASQGNGTTSHLTAEMFKMMAKVSMVHIPYRGSAPALTDLLAGNVDLMFDNLGVSLTMVNNGKLNLLGVGTEKRMASLPNVPAISEALPGFASVTWFAVAAPPKTPQEIADQLSADFALALRQPDIVSRLAGLSAEPVGSNSKETDAFLKAETERWGKVIKAAGIQIQGQ